MKRHGIAINFPWCCISWFLLVQAVTTLHDVMLSVSNWEDSKWFTFLRYLLPFLFHLMQMIITPRRETIRHNNSSVVNENFVVLSLDDHTKTLSRMSWLQWKGSDIFRSTIRWQTLRDGTTEQSIITSWRNIAFTDAIILTITK